MNGSKMLPVLAAYENILLKILKRLSLRFAKIDTAERNPVLI